MFYQHFFLQCVTSKNILQSRTGDIIIMLYYHLFLSVIKLVMVRLGEVVRWIKITFESKLVSVRLVQVVRWMKITL